MSRAKPTASPVLDPDAGPTGRRGRVRKQSTQVVAPPAPVAKPRNESAELILAKSAELFSERGYDGVSVRDLASACGVTLPTIYHYFGDKRKLYLEVCEIEFAQANAVMIAALNSSTKPSVRLTRFVEALCKLLSEDVRFSNLLQRELLDRDQELLEVTTRVGFMEEFKIVVDLVGEIDPTRNAERVAFSIYGIAFGLILLRPIGAVATSRALLPADNRGLAKFILSLAFPPSVRL